MLSFSSRLLAAAALALFAAPEGVWAQEVATVELGAPVTDRPGVSYLDLARMIVPDLAATGSGYSGHQMIELRHIGGPDEAADRPDTVEISGVTTLAVHSGGHDRLLLLFGFLDGEGDGGPGILALYDLSGAPRLLDAADVTYDTSTGFGDPARLSVAAGTDLVVTASTHSNAGESYAATPLILLRDDRLELVDVIYTYDKLYCGYRRDEILDLKAVDDGKAGLAMIRATVSDVPTQFAETCTGEEAPDTATHVYTVDYRWDEKVQRYVPGSDDFDRLDAENEKRY